MTTQGTTQPPAQGSLWRAPTARWHENPERTAWLVLVICFSIFALLAVTIPTAAIYTVRYASRAQLGRLDPTQGTLLLYNPGATEPIAVTSLRENIVEGTRIVAADEATQATLSLNSESSTGEALGSVQIYAGTDITLQRLREPFFGRSREPFRTVLLLDAGQARLFTSRSDNRAIDVELRTPHGLMTLQPGSYQVSVSEEQTEITVRSGSASLSHCLLYTSDAADE